jgi:ribosomal protein L16/L10AE
MNSAANKTAIAKAALALAASKLTVAEQTWLRARQERKGVRNV